ncbi:MULTISPECIES: type I polyketide synthase [unclassified Aureimonas]|uniref:type I polyketide synthase n=1 Tax=unclassified Aureimonas TaxID=2615206 RepID=UPI000710DB15|nr:MULTISPECIES: type I polyketide synthase [unclassified Aureimonas]KQT68982.1 hypothetical protein ASG54_04815 [Aureimonas sp. Leaf460]KQT69213.1 hypothetical protein ASG62_17420 [Aureimonas sp. Leaf427]
MPNSPRLNAIDATFADADAAVVSPSIGRDRTVTRQPIAIVGLSGRYPKAPDLDTLWSNLAGGVDGVGEAKGDRWDLGHHAVDVDSANRIYTKAGGFLDRVDLFDAEYFGMSPREARQVDPQHRLLLELAVEALDSAGLPQNEIAGSRTGVFVGISNNDYASLVGQTVDAYTNIGSALSIAANRVSYVFDLHGPSMSIDTACSSSMVAMHQACVAIASGECDMALAGGVNLLLSPRPFVGFSEASMLSPDGRCKSFDASGNGYVRAEGGGLVLLKSLEAAERDGDAILGVILGTGVNSDGRTMGLPMPSGEAQEALLREVYGALGLGADDIFYVEAHGTGTSVGDPIECGAIGRVLGAPRAGGTRCRIGSIKSNIGHLENAAGIAGLTKVLLAMRHGEIPANLHFATPNPKIDFETWKLEVTAEPVALPESETPLIFGVNSFGFGGTNGHMVVQAYRPKAAAARVAAPASAPEGEAFDDLLVLSAPSAEGLDAVASAHAAHLRAADPAEWPAIRATAARSRTLHAHRLVLSASGPAEAAARLERIVAGEMPSHAAKGKAAGAGRTALVFSGNGPQWWGMGRELLAESAIFRAEMEAVDAIFAPLAGWSLIEAMRRPEAEVGIERTEVAQPLLFAQQLALTAVLKAAGIRPDLVFGHSVGEAAAAHVSGALSREQATEVIFHRSQMQARTAGTGRMAALGLGKAEAEAYLAEIPGWLEIAAVNSPRAVTVAGDPAALEALSARLTEEGKFVRILALDYPFHTSAMDPIREELLERLAALRPGASAVPFVSTVEGAVVAGEALDADYWWRNIRRPVAFDAAVASALSEHAIDVFVEVGPHPVLRDYVLQCVKAAEGSSAQALATLKRPSANRPAPEAETLSTAICAIHAAGAGDLAALFERPAVPARLPAYPFNRTSFWRGGTELPGTIYPIRREHPLLGARLSSTADAWSTVVQTTLLPYLRDHVVQGSAIFPAAGYIELAVAAALAKGGEGVIDLETFEILKPLVLSEGAEPFVQTSVDPADGTLLVRSRPAAETADWTEHVKGRLSRPEGVEAPAPLDLAALRAAMPEHVSREAHYRGSDRRGLAYGPLFQGVTAIAMTPADATKRAALGEIAIPAVAGELSAYRGHPAILDNALQVLISLIGQNDPRDCATIPVQVGRIRSFAALPERVVCHVELRHESARTGVADIAIADETGRVLVLLEEARFQKVEFRPSALPILAEDWRPDPAFAPRRAVSLVLPSAEALAETLTPVVAGIAAAPERVSFWTEVRARLDALVAAYAAKALREIAEDIAEEGAPFTLASLARAGEVIEDELDLLMQLTQMAEAEGYLLRKAPSRAPTWIWSADKAPEPGALRRQLMLDHSGYGAELVAIARAGNALAARLRGETDGPAAVAMREMLDDTAPFRRFANTIAAEAVRALVASWPEGRAIRVCELSGGTGGLAAAVLPVLPQERSDYLFADASDQALSRARNRFSAHHFLRTAGSAEAPESGFDLVLSAGEVEASTLFETLLPGGIALLVETLPGRVADLLMPRRSEAGSPDPAESLVAAGFETPVALSDASAGAEPTHRVWIARRPEGAASADILRLPGEAGRRVLVVGPSEAEQPFVAALSAALEASGQTVAVRALDPADLGAEALAELVASEPGAAEFVHLAGFAAGTPGTDAILSGQDLRCLSALHLARAIEMRPLDAEGPAPVLTLVTRHAFAGPAGTGPVDPFQSTVAGLGRVMANEQASVGCRLIDVHAALDDAEAAGDLAHALLARDAEPETLLSGGRRFVHRVRQSSIAEQTRIARSLQPGKTEARPFRLDFLPQGGLDSLHLREIERRTPGEGEIEIAIRAAGLNFRDVLYAMGMLPEEAVEKGFSGPTIGMECAGEVLRVGPGVTALKPGDRVIAFASSCFASHVTTKADCAALLPADIPFEAAATIPTAFVTAWYALDHLARLEPGETVLIHGAAGGVGLAALQIAKLRGAVVIASAGSPDKQQLVRDMGADHVVSSRSTKFADDIMALTKGEGIDVVLNSLAGEAITKGLQVLKPFGRFLEIGKRDLYANSRIGLRPFRQNLSYFGIDADTLLVERPALAKRMFDAVVAALASGDLKPLPYQATPVSRAAEAFRAMQQARHVGKLVVSLDAERHENLAILSSGRGTVRPDVTYLVTGGLSGFGLATAEWLVAEGARSLALLGRRGATTEEAKAGLARIRAAGAVATGFAVDVADREALDRVLFEIRATMPPLKGVVHAAAVIEDAPLMNVDRGLMHRVMSAKMIGAWNLHEMTLADGLESFVLYSSSSAVVGNPGQGTYVAANTFLDTLAEHRRALGLPALSVGWGAIKDAGFLTRNAAVEDMLEQRAGMSATPVRDALAELGRLMGSGACRVAAAQFNLMRLGQSLPGARSPRFSSLIPDSMSLVPEGAGSIAAALEAMGEEDRRALLLTCVAGHVGRVVGSDAAQITPEKSLTELGLDSLMAVELAEALEHEVGRPISVMQMIQAGTVGGVVQIVLQGFSGTRASAEAKAPAAAPDRIAA